MMTYFQAASSDRDRPFRPTRAALASVLASTRTNSRPRLPVSSAASISEANKPKNAKYSRTWKPENSPSSSDAET